MTMPRRSVLATAVSGALAKAFGGSRPAAAAQSSTPSGAPDAVAVERGVAYGEAAGQELLLDVYRPPTRAEPRPAVVLIHGGAWSFGSPSDMATPARRLAEAGYVAFAIAHRYLQADGSNAWPAQLDDAQLAVRWIRANAAEFGVDPERIGSYGHSSGGHLAALLGTRETRADGDPVLADYSSRVQCVVDLAGDTDLAIPYPPAMDNEIAINLLGGTAEEVPETYRDASPLAAVDAETVPFLVFHGGADDINPVAHSRLLVEALHEAGVEVVYVELPRAGHLDWADWSLVGPYTLAFLDRHLRPEE